MHTHRYVHVYIYISIYIYIYIYLHICLSIRMCIYRIYMLGPRSELILWRFLVVRVLGTPKFKLKNRTTMGIPSLPCKCKERLDRCSFGLCCRAELTNIVLKPNKYFADTGPAHLLDFCIHWHILVQLEAFSVPFLLESILFCPVCPEILPP